MRCLVTGGAGFIGSHLVEALVARGDQVRVLDNLSTGFEQNLEPLSGKIELRQEDLRDESAIDRACEQIDVVFHVAAMPSVPRSLDDPVTSFEINARGTLNVLLAARNHRVQRVVYSASSSAYGDTEELPKHERMTPQPKSPYAADKLHGENLCRVFTEAYRLPCVALRYFNVFGPRQRPDSAYAAVIPKFLDAMIRNETPTIYGDGEQSRDFTYIDNAVSANLLAAASATAPGLVLNIGSGSRTTLNEVLRAIAKECGAEPRARHEAARVGDVRHSQADIALAKKHLGYAPTVGLEEGLRRTIAAFRARPREAAKAAKGRR
jgi:UDP-N-acetylglucosamine/UDP-N-acetyl-alpha-D-glucosaminouronate 4-epimerase